MRILLVGVGGVGEALAVIAQDRPWLETMVLADINPDRVREVRSRLRVPGKFEVERVDASDRGQIVELARRHRVDMIVNAVEPLFNEAIFDAAYEAGCHYLDMAMTLSAPHPSDPFHATGVKLGDYQFERSAAWQAKGLLALVGMGVEPGMADVFARYAQKHLFDRIEEIGVRDGSNLEVRGYEFAPNFSIWTTIEECLNPPVIWEKDRGWYTTEPFSEPELFDFPEGIGPQECVNVEHEEVLLVPRWVDCRRVTFKYGLGADFIRILKTIKLLGLDRKDRIRVGDVMVAPRDVVAACLPDPAHLGDRMVGKTCAGTWVTGVKDGAHREVYLYQVADNETCMRQYGVQAVVWQTAVNPVIALELIERGTWHGTGVLGPEAFDPDPFVELMPVYDFPFHVRELIPALV
ncbi:MAG TPA: saccharopine dehydrogenase C-terminal domain-containing protein [Candidatus Sulfotelmatobacter sp.]|nr:saccharopine dehydrogenase C-terminal domain-containing protein [Candidatus Sulfotelmatobacter sp.]